MLNASFTVDPSFRVGAVDPRLYGSFVEHMGRCVYTGIYEPGHTDADADGFRQDVAGLVRESPRATETADTPQLAPEVTPASDE